MVLKENKLITFSNDTNYAHMKCNNNLNKLLIKLELETI